MNVSHISHFWCVVYLLYLISLSRAGKGVFDAHAEKRMEELQARVRELERQNGQLKEKVCHF